MSCEIPSGVKSVALRVGHVLRSTERPEMMPMVHRACLRALSDFADAQGECFPSLWSICKSAGIASEVTARKALHELRERGFISIHNETFAHTSNKYTIHMERGQWWDVEEQKAKKTRALHPSMVKAKNGATPPQSALGGQSALPPQLALPPQSALGGTTIGATGGGQSALDEESIEQSIEQTREREVASLLLAPSARDDAPAPVTSPSPVAPSVVVQEEVKQTVQVGQQGTLPGVEAPKVVQKTKRAPRATSVPAKAKLTDEEKASLRKAEIEAWIPNLETLATIKECGLDDTWIRSFRLKLNRYPKIKAIHFDTTAQEWALGDAQKKNTGALPFGRGLSQTTKVDRVQPAKPGGSALGLKKQNDGFDDI